MSTAYATLLQQAPDFASRSSHGCYKWKGESFVSVTTVLDLASGSFLNSWHAKEAALECSNVMAKMQAEEIPYDDGVRMILNWQERMTAALRYRDHKGAIGSLAHHSIHERVLGIPVPDGGPKLIDFLVDMAYRLDLATPNKDAPDETQPYALSLAHDARHYVTNLFDWMDDEVPDFDMVGLEAAVYCPEYGYAGTMDYIARFPRRFNRRYAGDYKTSNALAKPKVRKQLEAYRRANFIGLVATGTEEPMPQTDGAMAIHIPAVGTCETVVWDDKDLGMAEEAEGAFDAFLGLLGTYRFDELGLGPKKPPRIKRPGRNVNPFGDD